MSDWHTPGGQLDPLKVRAAYPILSTTPGGRPLHYLDSAATAQRPKAVVDAVSNFLLTANANPHRGAYTLGGDATAAYEGARARTAAFLGVPAEELVMLGSATEALNLVARSWGRANLSRGDVVLVTEAEHHANLIPWQQVTREVDADLEFIPVDDVTGEDRGGGPRLQRARLRRATRADRTANPRGWRTTCRGWLSGGGEHAREHSRYRCGLLRVQRAQDGRALLWWRTLGARAPSQRDEPN